METTKGPEKEQSEKRQTTERAKHDQRMGAGKFEMKGRGLQCHRRGLEWDY